MSIDSTMALLYAQTGLAAPLAHAAGVSPYASHAISQLVTQEMAQKENKQIQKIENSAMDTSISDEDREGKGTFMSQERQKKHEDAEDEEIPAPSLYVGNILNVKV